MMNPIEPASGSVTDRVAAAITDAIIEHRLAAGTKLVEQNLATMFGVSRTIVRQALIRLERARLIKLEPAKGASVAMPSVKETRQIFTTRRYIEIPMITEFARTATKAHIKLLRMHLSAEQKACLQPDVHGRTRMLADFHVLIAQIMGNTVLEEVLSQLVSRTSLAAMLYQTRLSAEHSSDEHVELLDAIESKNVELAAQIMTKHLNNVEASLNLDASLTDMRLALMPLNATH
jgi:DNA-binding GntR family transcriptional regulator